MKFDDYDPIMLCVLLFENWPVPLDVGAKVSSLRRLEKHGLVDANHKPTNKAIDLIRQFRGLMERYDDERQATN